MSDLPTPKLAEKKSGPAQQVVSQVPSKYVPEGTDKSDVVAVSMCPPPRLGQFYDFFSFSDLTPPVHCEFVLSLTFVQTVCGNHSRSVRAFFKIVFGIVITFGMHLCPSPSTNQYIPKLSACLGETYIL